MKINQSCLVKKYRFLRGMARPFLNWGRLTIGPIRHSELPSLKLLWVWKLTNREKSLEN